MNMSKHTPKPWRWETIPGARGKKRRVLMGGTPGGPQHKILTQASDCVKTDSVHERLIAAAPDLLEALEQIVNDWENVSKRVPVPDEINEDAHWEAARAAIIKATIRIHPQT